MKRYVVLAAFLSSGIGFSQINSSVVQINSETPSGVVNGANATFALHNTPASSSSVVVYRNGIRQMQGLDYSVSGNSIVFSPTAPSSGDAIQVDYLAPTTTPLTIGASGLNLNGQTVSGSGTFSGPITFNSPVNFGAQPVTLQSAQAGWNEFKIATGYNQAGNTQSDWFGFFYNTRTGTTDNWNLGAYIGINTGWVFISPMRIYGGLTLQSGVNLNGQTLAGNAALSGIISQQSVNSAVRAVSSSSDTATVNDHTLVMNGVTSENLPASPTAGQEIFLVNTAAWAVTVSGNQKSVWSGGTTGNSVTVAANGTAILQFDGSVWRQIK